MKRISFLIPAYNEEKILEKNVNKLYNYFKRLKELKKYKWELIISDNNSVDNTLKIAKKLAKKYPKVTYVHMNKRPKSYCMKTVWIKEEADYYIVMDADLSADIKHTTQLIDGLEKGYDIVMGSRVSKEFKSKRSFFRKIISYFLIFLLKTMFSIKKVEDFQCGFKAVNRKVRDKIIPKMRSLGVGFMDTEMILVANSKGYKIKSFPVGWKDTRKSHAPLIKGIFDALLNLFKIKFLLIKGAY